MSGISVQGRECPYAYAYSSSVVAALQMNPEAMKTANMLVENQSLSLSQPFMPSSIGSVDATSCVCPVYFWDKKHVVVHHHDERDLSALAPFFGTYKNQTLDVVLVGGLIEKSDRGEWNFQYTNLEKHTRGNIDQLVTFWRNNGIKVNLLTWAIGKDKDKSTLVSDFLADPTGKVMLVKPELMHSAIKTQEAVRRAATNLTNNNYNIIYDEVKDPKQLFLADASSTHHSRIKSFGEGIKNLKEDPALLKKYSTTPAFEPSYFCQHMRDLSRYILDDSAPSQPVSVPTDPAQPVVVLQGEAGRRTIQSA